MRVQIPLTTSVGYRTEQLCERRIAGLGNACACVDKNACKCANQLKVDHAPRIPVPIMRRVVQPAHPDTVAYSFAGSLPSPFDDPFGWTSTLTPLAKPSWVFPNIPAAPRIGTGPRHGGPIGKQQVRFGTYGNAPFFAAPFKLKKKPWNYPTWPCASSQFRFVGKTRDDTQKGQMWPHVAAGSAGDVPIVFGQYLRVLPWALPSGTYVNARMRRQPRYSIPNVHQIDPRAMKYDPGTKPGLAERTVTDEQIYGVRGLGDTEVKPWYKDFGILAGLATLGLTIIMVKQGKRMIKAMEK